MSTKRAIRDLEVSDCNQLTPHMRRLTLVGGALADFPVELVGGYVKLLFPKTEPTRSGRLGGLEDPVELSHYVKRSYTVRSFDRKRLSIEIDFVVGSDKGVATRWASAAGQGDSALVVGPGPVKLVDPTADWFLLAGDMTALPAIGVNAERLPSAARGYAIIEVLTEADIQELQFPAGVDVRWLVTAVGEPSRLCESVRELAWLEGRPSVWSACEFDEMRQLRGYLREERAVDKSNIYLSSYWKRNATDEQHKQAKASAAS